ncbi:uncharacterized protein LOC105198330 isoform X2 [Solenopsis invicta]|uniref:uncharacterized protein LOC105198330 isoform X2 n=1 Tax=Solenopsis invicta TaxID=13686 RepID=UPI00193E591D|nr:uncharacterized protein LOC105198330 isoform X2 [Solenopsis invicta]XP_039311465.1 uncharacterized protein LOC105198330 isoform X2 [Solenopsis invicta]
MNTSEIQHFSLNRILLLSIGLWPYKQSKLVLFQQILFFGLLTSFTVYQIILYFITEITDDFIVILSFILVYIVFIIEYNSFLINDQVVKNLLEQFIHVYDELKDENEIDVMKKYISKAKRYIDGVTIVTVVALFTSMLITTWTSILDIVKPNNESRSDLFITYLTAHFANPDKYRYLMLLYLNTTIYIGGIAISGTASMLMGYLVYACGMFRIASYRIERAMTINNLYKNFEHETEIYKGIINAVNIHRKTMKICNYFMSSFNGTWSVLIVVGVLSLSLNIYQVFHCVAFGSSKQEFIIHFVLVAETLLYMFLTNYFGQEIINHNNHIFITVYNGDWYIAPLHVQKLILFLLQVGNKTFGLRVNGLFTASLHAFASLINASISYFTFMCSTHKQ